MVNLKNTGSASVSINSIVATGNFAVTSNSCGSTLGAGATCSVSVTFTPSVGEAITGSLAISDSAVDSPQTVALSGTGNLPLTISPAPLAFGTVAVGTTSAAKTVVITNNLSSNLSYSSAASRDYAISSSGTTCTGSLAAKAKCNIAVTFSPTVAAAITGAVSLTDGTSFSPQLVALSGTGSGGSAPPFTFTPSNLSFAGQAVGTTSTGKTVTVKNNSAGAVTFGAIASSGEFSASGRGTKPCGADLNLTAGASCTMSVTFSPAFGASGSVSGAVVITDNAAVGEQILDVKGTAALPLSFSPTSLTFAPQTVGTASTAQPVTLTNNLATSVSPTIAGNGDYIAAAGGATPCIGTPRARAKCTFTVTFTPSAVGMRGSAITATDSANPGVQTMSVSGTGQ